MHDPDAFDKAAESLKPEEQAPWPPPVEPKPYDIRLMSKRSSVSALKRLGAKQIWGD